MNTLLQISAGTGPRECQMALMHVAGKIERLLSQYAGTFRVWDKTPDIDDSQYKSVVYELLDYDSLDFLAPWLGSICWRCQSPLRPNHKRKNWFVEINLLSLSVEQFSLNQTDIRIENFRASGPGGQHKNKTETAVRVTHLPTGICVIAKDERKQALNKATAIKRLKLALMTQNQLARQEAGRTIHSRHAECKRGAAVKIFTGLDFKEST